MESIIIPIDYIDLNKYAREWCKLPYPLHPKGCPNYGTRITCPPLALKFNDLIKAPFWLIGVRFDLAKHIRKMKEKHPNWSLRQCKCVLYWQNHVNKILREESERFASTVPNSIILYKPEANGVQVFNTCFKAGIKLERNPLEYVWKISIVGIKNDRSNSGNN